MAKQPKPRQQLSRPSPSAAPPVTCVACNWRKPSQDLFKKMAGEAPEQFPPDFNGYTFVKWQGSVLALAYVKGRQVSAFPLDATQVAEFTGMMNDVATSYLAELAAGQDAPAESPLDVLALGDLSDPDNEAGREVIRAHVQAQIDKQQNGIGAPVHIELGEVHESDFLRAQRAQEVSPDPRAPKDSDEWKAWFDDLADEPTPFQREQALRAEFNAIDSGLSASEFRDNTFEERFQSWLDATAESRPAGMQQFLDSIDREIDKAETRVA